MCVEVLKRCIGEETEVKGSYVHECTCIVLVSSSTWTHLYVVDVDGRGKSIIGRGSRVEIYMIDGRGWLVIMDRTVY